MADGDVDIPKIGPLPKKVLIPLAVGLAGFVAWRFWQAKKGTGADAGDSTVTDGDFGAVDSSIPGVVGAVSPTNSYGDSGNTTDNGDDPTRFTNNAQWTEYVVGKLQQSDTWSYTDIVTAIGLGLAGKPTTTAQQSILRAALAIGGQPPSGAIVIVSGGNTSITVAPTGLKVTAVTQTTVSLSWNAVPGAASYRVYRSGASTNVGSSTGTTIRIDGLQPATSYSFHVAALSSSAQAGPNSANVNAKTSAYALAKPSTPTVGSITKNSVKVSTKAVPHADGYRWYINGGTRGYSESPTNYSIGGLAAGHKYTVTVAADLAHQNPGPVSAGKTFTTKK
jgi:hypothetical protein